VHRGGNQSLLVTLLALSNAVGVLGLLFAPAFMPWVWSVALGTGMGGLAMALTTISVRSDGNADIGTALSGMVQGLGYIIAGVGALACGLVHSVTGGWQAPLVMALVVLCGQIWSGTRAARPIVVRPVPAVSPSQPPPTQPLSASIPLPSAPLTAVPLPTTALPSLPISVAPTSAQAMTAPEEVLPDIPLPRVPILPVAQPERAAEPT
jgi:CP family cyanate transporter-like MFS transporter